MSMKPSHLPSPHPTTPYPSLSPQPTLKGKDIGGPHTLPSHLKGYMTRPKKGQAKGPLLGDQEGMQHTTVYCLSILTTRRLLSQPQGGS